MTRGKKIHKVLLADTHNLFKKGLRTLLSTENDMEVVGEASDLKQAVAEAQLLHPDVLVMDLSLVSADPEATLALRQLDTSVSTLILTQEDTPGALEMAISAGARGYMLKNSSAAQLVAGIRQVSLSDEQDPRGLSRLVPDLQALAATERSYPRASALTSREQEVMTLLAEGRTVREVAEELSLSVKTIEAHKLNLMRKLDIHNRATLVEYAVRAGLVPAHPMPGQPA